jgi:excisionase family DNA binding protein
MRHQKIILLSEDSETASNNLSHIKSMPSEHNQDLKSQRGVNPMDDYNAPSRRIYEGGLIKKSAIAQYCQVSIRTIDHWMYEKRIPYIKVGRNVRFRRPAVEEALLRYERRSTY